MGLCSHVVSEGFTLTGWMQPTCSSCLRLFPAAATSFDPAYTKHLQLREAKRKRERDTQHRGFLIVLILYFLLYSKSAFVEQNPCNQRTFTVRPKKKQTPLLKETKEISALNMGLPFLCLLPGELNLFSLSGCQTHSERRGHKSPGSALMTLSLNEFPEPIHARGMLDTG